MISLRFAPAVIIVLGLALLPTLAHTYVGIVVAEPRKATAIDTSLGGLPSEPSARSAAWVARTFGTEDFVERRYKRTGAPDLLLFVAQSYDAKRLYHHPEIGLVKGVDFRRAGTLRLTDAPEIPIHMLTGPPGQGGLAAYALLYQQEFVNHMSQFEFRRSWKVLLRGPAPLTLFFAHDPAAQGETRLAHVPAAKLVRDAVRSFLAQPAAQD